MHVTILHYHYHTQKALSWLPSSSSLPPSSTSTWSSWLWPWLLFSHLDDCDSRQWVLCQHSRFCAEDITGLGCNRCNMIEDHGHEDLGELWEWPFGWSTQTKLQFSVHVHPTTSRLQRGTQLPWGWCLRWDWMWVNIKDDNDVDNDIYIMMKCLFVCNEKSSLP